MSLSDNPHFHRIDTIGPEPADARLVIVLIHGRGSDGPSMIQMTTGITTAADVARIAPTAANNTWYPDSFMAPWEANEPWIDHTLSRFSELLDGLNANGVSDNNIVVTGFSQGAAVAAEIALRRPRKYGAVVVFTGGYIGPAGTTWNPPSGLEDVPILISTGDVDEWVPLERVEATAAVFEAAGASVDYRVFEGKDHDVSHAEKRAASALIAEIDTHARGDEGLTALHDGGMNRWPMRYDWAGRLGSDQIAALKAVVDVSDPLVATGIERWLEVLDRDSVRHLTGEVYGHGGATVTVVRNVPGKVMIELRSGGEDAFDSIQTAAAEVHAAVAGVGDVQIHWVEMPYEPAY